MKIPELPPNWLNILRENLTSIFESEENSKLNEFVRRIERREEYVYWDKIKFLQLPESIKSELAWAYLKFSRQSKIQPTTLISKNGGRFGYWIPSSVLEKISYIDKYASGQILIDEPVLHSGERKKYLISSLMEEAIASSILEGAATTRKAAKEMLRSGRKPRNHSEKMVYNNYQTITKIKELIKSPLNNDLILELHHSMTVDTLEHSNECGRFRTDEDEPIYVKSPEGETLYTPPEPKKIPPMMKLLYDYANEDNSETFTHPVIKAINLHFYLAYIHPFMDGNGRTARALFYWYILKQKYWMFEFLTISRIFLKAPSQYARAFLYTENDDLDLTYFISFHLKVISIAISELISYMLNKQKEVRKIDRYLKQYQDLNERQKALIKHAMDNPESQYIISMHKTVNNITYETARTDLLELVKLGLLDKIKKGRKFYFVPLKNLSLKLHQRKR
jgi:Fic family protein